MRALFGSETHSFSVPRPRSFRGRVGPSRVSGAVGAGVVFGTVDFFGVGFRGRAVDFFGVAFPIKTLPSIGWLSGETLQNSCLITLKWFELDVRWGSVKLLWVDAIVRYHDGP
jgi:hypothetical protein